MNYVILLLETVIVKVPNNFYLGQLRSKRTKAHADQMA